MLLFFGKNIFLSKRHVTKQKNACDKPETPQAGLGVTNPYHNAVDMVKYSILTNIGIKQGPI